jgi:PAS domain S-box-containing protein
MGQRQQGGSMDANKIFADKYGKDLMELHKLMVELEQIEIVRQRSGKPHWKTEKEYRDFFAKQTEAVAILQNEIIVRINPQISEMIGYSPEEVVGIPFAQFIHPSELPRVQKNYENRIEGKEVPRSIYIIIKAGTITYWEKPAIFLIAEIDSDQKDK